MKKFLFWMVSLAIAGAIAWGVYMYVFTPEVTVCFRIGQLCEIDDEGVRDQCEATLSDMEPKLVRQAAECVTEATTCAEATGCAVGLGLKTGAGALDGFIKGVEDVLKD